MMTKVTFDPAKIKVDFPLLQQQVHGRPLVYLDNAATSQKPQAVINALTNFYSHSNANVHRGLYYLSETASELYDSARAKVAQFFGAASPNNIVFTRNCTEALNLVAVSWARHKLKAGDEILVSDLEHHSNLLPWQEICKETGARLKIFRSTTDNLFDEAGFRRQLTNKSKLVAVSHASNVSGTIMPMQKIIALAHQQGALVVIDGAQAAPHLALNLQKLDCDFYALSAHKMLGPMGIGVLYAKEELLAQMTPYQLGGGMISDVSYQDCSFAEAPEKFEAGTPNVAGAIAFAAALNYLSQISMEQIRRHEIELNRIFLEALATIPELVIVGPKEAEQRTGLVSFYHPQIHAHDLAELLNQSGFALRAGFHCAIPLHKDRQWPATLRASYYLYNQGSELEQLVAALKKALQKFR